MRVGRCGDTVFLVHTYRSDTLGELVERHPGLLLHDPGGPAECVVRRGELVVPRDSVDAAVRELDRWVDHVDRADHVTLRLRPGAADACVRIAAEVGARLPVSANHVHATLVGTPILHGTGAVPTPAPLPPEPPREVWDPPVTVLVLDTGVDPHPWFTHRPWFGEWGPRPEILDGDDDGVTDRQAAHGTFVTGVVLQHAPGVTVRHHRVLSSHGLTDDRTVASALRRTRGHAAARGEHIDVVLVTAGCHTADDRCPPILAREFARFTDTVLVAAAGNAGTTRPFWPAALPAVVAVGATTPSGALADFSGRGPWVDRAAPGVDVVSSHVRLDRGTRAYGGARWSGTSFAAPRIAAEAATLLHQGTTAAATFAALTARAPS
ncbi:S8 family peptidase [Actinokineospora sp.]|uniref:S8 family peptidase n=1 Tax=Actinokineospora sp. TaxID=1872133 RepID=UPI004037B827